MAKKAKQSTSARSAPLGLRIKPALKDALLAAAGKENRSLANYIEWELEKLMRDRGILKED